MALRYERKYLVPNELITSLRKRLHPFLVPDHNGHITHFGVHQYTVRSIYLDSNDMECYRQKESGIKIRRKLRIRGYNQWHPNSKVVLEIKRKTGGRIDKHRSMVHFCDLKDTILTGNIEDNILRDTEKSSLDDARRFFFHLKKKQYAPSSLVAYEREAYQGNLNRGLRITFDKNIRSKVFPDYDELFEDNELTPLFNNHFVMEIKYFSDRMPTWARSLVQEFGLRNDAISKYTIGYDVARYNKKLTY
ncbi:MAG: polyphosphate polymerase domain-containing protein [Marinilabilia sp.]